MQNIIFIVFSLLTIICGFLVITSKNPIHSVLFLVLVFFNVASLLIFLGVEFLALLFLIVYVGAVAVLFLFIIMMLSLKIPDFKTNVYQYIPIGALLATCFLTEIIIVLNNELTSLISFLPYFEYNYNLFSFVHITFWSLEVNSIQNIKAIAMVLYTYYALLFLLAGLILLVAMLGAIVLTLHKKRDIKRQDIYKQVQQEFEIVLSWKK